MNQIQTQWLNESYEYVKSIGYQHVLRPDTHCIHWSHLRFPALRTMASGKFLLAPLAKGLDFGTFCQVSDIDNLHSLSMAKKFDQLW